MRELYIKIDFNIIYAISSENFIKCNLKFPFKTKFFSCILFLQDNFLFFPKLCAYGPLI